MILDILGKLHTLHADTTAATREDDPVAGLQPRIHESTVHGTRRAHDRSRNLIRHAIRNPTRVHGRRGKVLHIRALTLQAGVISARAVILPPVPALLAVVAHVLERLDAHAVPDLEVLDVVAELDDDAGALVARAPHAEEGHGWQRPVVHHEVHVGHAEAGGVEADEHFVGFCGEEVLAG